MATRCTPCMGCPERFTACSDKCPKDARGEYGYKAWKADHQRIKAAEKEYKRQQYEDYLRSERCEVEKYNYARSRSGRRD